MPGGILQYLSNHQNQLAGRETNICTSQTCQSAAKSILDSIDFNVDPCDDFYQYTCKCNFAFSLLFRNVQFLGGAWAKHHDIPDSQSCWWKRRVYLFFVYY